MLTVTSNASVSWLRLKTFFIGILSNTTTTSLLRAVHHFGRAVIMFGVPYVYTQSRILKVRTKSPPTTEATKRPCSTRPASCPDSRPDSCSSRLVWNTCGITSRSGRTTSSRLTPCDTPPSAWAEPSEGKPTTA